MIRSQQNLRSGLVTIAVIVVLTVTTGLCLQLARRAILLYQSVQQQQIRLQCENLAAAGILRAERALQKSTDYSGEVWIVEAGKIHPKNSAQIQITVSGSQLISQARYPANQTMPCTTQQTKRIEP